MGLQELDDRVALEGQHTRQKLVEHDAEAVEIASAVQLVAARQGPVLLGRGVLQLAEEDARGGRLDRRFGDFRDAEIDELDQGAALLVARQHEVVGRHVAVDDALAVQVPQGEKRLVGDLEGERQARPPVQLEEIRHVDAVDELHDEIGHAGVVDGEVVDRADVRVLQPRGGPRLLDEPAPQILVRDDARLHHLDDADLLEKAVADPIDGAHAALADLVEDLVLAFEKRARLNHCGTAPPAASPRLYSALRA